MEQELQIVINGVDNASREFQEVNNSMKRLRPTMKKMAAYGGAAAAGIGYMGKKMLDSAGDAEMVQGRFDAVFQDTHKSTTNWVNELSKEYGRAESTMQGVASSVGGQLQMVASELPEEEISEMTKNLSEQSVAMSAYYKNLQGTEDAGNALSAALAGQTERLTSMGYSVNVQSEQFENMRKELGFTKDEMNSTKEALVIYNLIMEQNEMVMDAYSNTQDNYNEMMERAREQVKRVSETIGAALIPVVGDILERIIPLIEGIAQWIEENQELTKWIFIIAGSLASLVAILGSVGLAVIAVTAALIPWVLIIGLVVLAIGTLILAGVRLWKNWELTKNMLGAIWDTIKKRFQKGIKAILDILAIILPGGMVVKKIIENWDKIKNYFETLWENIVLVFSSAKDSIMSFLEPIIETAKNVIDLAKKAKSMAGDVLGGAGETIGGAIGRITPFADGGIVTEPTLGMVGEDGPEAVLPLGKMGGETHIHLEVGGQKISEIVMDDMNKRLKRRIAQ